MSVIDPMGGGGSTLGRSLVLALVRHLTTGAAGGTLVFGAWSHSPSVSGAGALIGLASTALGLLDKLHQQDRLVMYRLAALEARGSGGCNYPKEALDPDLLVKSLPRH